MIRTGFLGAVMLSLTACAAASSDPPEAVNWEPGEYLLEASVTYSARSQNQVDRHSAELEIAADGTMNLVSSTGLCQGPPLTEMGDDRARGRRTFNCGETRYELRPAGQTVIGELVAAVVEEEVVVQCVRYVTSAEGQQVCVETREVVVQRPTTKRARLNVVVR